MSLKWAPGVLYVMMLAVAFTATTASATSGTCQADDETCNQQDKSGIAMLQKMVSEHGKSAVVDMAEEEAAEAEADDNQGEGGAFDWHRIHQARFDAEQSTKAAEDAAAAGKEPEYVDENGKSQDGKVNKGEETGANDEEEDNSEDEDEENSEDEEEDDSEEEADADIHELPEEEGDNEEEAEEGSVSNVAEEEPNDQLEGEGEKNNESEEEEAPIEEEASSEEEEDDIGAIAAMQIHKNVHAESSQNFEGVDEESAAEEEVVYKAPNAETGVDDSEGFPAPNCSNMGPVPEPQTSCPKGGRLLEGSCWFLDSSKSSLHDCNTVCSKKGLMYDPMTRYYAGDCGSAYKCSQLGHLFNMPGDADIGRKLHEKPKGKYDDHPCMGCLIFDPVMMKKHIITYDGDWMENYKVQGVAWMPGKDYKFCPKAAPKSFGRTKGWRERWFKQCGPVTVKGTHTATDARCSSNMGPPTRACACKAKADNGRKCGGHGECSSGFCKGAPMAQGESSGLAFVPQVGICSSPVGQGGACSMHGECVTGFCNGGTSKCDRASWSETNGAVIKGVGRLSSPWCLSNGPDGCAVVLSMVGAGIKRAEAIDKAKKICAMIDDCNSVWCCTTGCTNAICYASRATTPNYKMKDCPGLKGSFLESKIPVKMWTISRPGSHTADPNAPPAHPMPKANPTVPRPFTKLELDWAGVQNHDKGGQCFNACGKRGGFCDFCGPKGACCQAGLIEWETGKASQGCDEAITLSAGHGGFACVPTSTDRPKKMTDADTGELLSFLPMDQRFTLPKAGRLATWVKNQDLTGLNFQVLLKGYQCGPQTSTWAKTYHDHNTNRKSIKKWIPAFREYSSVTAEDSDSGWKTARWCMEEGKKRGHKVILWTAGWTGREQGMKYIDPSYNCAFEKTQDVECPEGFTKVQHKGTWHYIELLPDGPQAKVDGSMVLKEGAEVTKDDVKKALIAASLGARDIVTPADIDVVDVSEHAGGGVLVRYVASIAIVRDLTSQLSDPNSLLAKSALGDDIEFPAHPQPKPAPPPSPKPPARKGKGGSGGSRKGGKQRKGKGGKGGKGR